MCAALLQEIEFSITNDEPNDGNIDMVDWKRTAAALQEIHASFNQESESLGQVHLQLPSICKLLSSLILWPLFFASLTVLQICGSYLVHILMFIKHHVQWHCIDAT